MKRISACAIITMLTAANGALAQSRQDEVFKAIQDNVSDQVSGEALIIFGVIIVAGALLILISAASKRERKRSLPATVNHPGKLMKEVLKSTGMRPADIKRLKALVERLEQEEDLRIKNPLTLMICPSILSRAMKESESAAAE